MNDKVKSVCNPFADTVKEGIAELDVEIKAMRAYPRWWDFPMNLSRRQSLIREENKRGMKWAISWIFFKHMTCYH